MTFLLHLLIRRIIRPIDNARNELQDIQAGKRHQIVQSVPSEFQPLVDEINALLKTNEQRLQRSRNATGNLAHALKTPLTVLTQLADSKEVKQTPELAKELQQISLQIQNTINHELKHARLAGASLAGKRLNISQELKELIRVLEKIYAHKSIHIEMLFPKRDTEEITIQADREDMMELFGNLLDNACKWAEKTIKVSVFVDQGLYFSVEDDGQGIAIDKLQGLTQRGVRLDENTPGHGLGLSIVNDIVKQYDGTINFEPSSKLKGLKVLVYLNVT